MKTQKIMEEFCTKENYESATIARIMKRFSDFDNAIEKAEADGELIKSEFKNITERLGYLWDEVKSRLIWSIRPRVSFENESDLDAAMSDTPYSRTGFNKYHRNLVAQLKSPEGEKDNSISAAKQIVEIMEEFIELNNRVNNVKDLIVAKKSDVVAKNKAKEDESAKRASHKDTVKTRNYLTAMLENEKENLINSLIDINQKKADRKIEFAKEKSGVPEGFEHKRTTIHGRTSYVPPTFSLGELRSIATDENPFEHDYSNRSAIVNIAPINVIADRVKNESTNQANFLIDEYVHRVTEKLGYFFEKKSQDESLKGLEKLSIELLGNIDAKLRVLFHDKSQFDLHTQTIWASNPKSDGYHVKVQTRFTNALKPDGSKVKSPSEKRVQDELAM